MSPSVQPPESVLATASGWALIRSLARSQRGGIALGVTVGLIWSASKVTVPILVRKAVDRGVESGDLRALLFWSAAVAAAGAVSAVFTGLRRYLAFRESRLSERRLRDAIFAHIQRLPFAYHDRTQTGQLMSRANTDLQRIQALIVMIPLTLSNLLIVAASLLVLVSVHPTLTLLSVGALPAVNWLGRRFATRLHPAMVGIQEEAAQLASVVEESVAGVRVVKGFGAEAVQARRLGTEADDVFAVAMQAARVRATYAPAIELLPNLGLIAALGYGGHLVLAHQLSIGTLVMFNFFVVLLVAPLRMLGQIIATAERASAAAERVAEVLATVPAIVDDPAPIDLPAAGASEPPRGAIRFDHVDFHYEGREQVPVLRDFSLQVAPGESVALVGATGSGKTTVARLLARFYDVSAGRVELDGVDVRRIPLAQLRRSIATVFEDTFLFNDSIGGNIAFARPEASAEAITEAARLAGAHDFIAALPEGYATPIGERGLSLSGGQRQRLALARALLVSPRVLVLDDATSSVDPSKEHEIRDALAQVMRGRTTLVIAHRPATIALAQRVVLLSGGRVVAEGTHQELLATSAEYRQVLATSETRTLPPAALVQAPGAGEPVAAAPSIAQGAGGWVG